MRTATLGVLSLLILVLVGGAAEADGSYVVLYDVDFSAPLHVVGSAPTTGADPAPRATPTRIRRGPATVLAAYGGLLDQPLAFPGPGRGDVGFSLADMPVCPDYHLGMDLVVDFDLRLLLSTPVANVVHFQSDGDIEVSVRDLATGGSVRQVVGQYTPGAVHQLDIAIDLVNDTFDLSLDGFVLHQGTFGGQAALTEFRILGTRAAVDNVVVDSGEAVSEIRVPVDIRPRSEGPAPVNPRSRGVLPVALLSTVDLHVLEVDEASLALTAEGADAVAPLCMRRKDVDDDGLEDLLLFFHVPALVRAGVVTKEGGVLVLTGETLDGTLLRGEDDIRIVGRASCRKRGRRR